MFIFNASRQGQAALVSARLLSRVGLTLLVIVLGLYWLMANTVSAGALIALEVDRIDDSSGLACSEQPDDCTLRSAIEVANANGGDAIISFQNDTMQIELAAQLPTIQQPNTVISTTQFVEVVASAEIQYGLYITASHTTINGLQIHGARDAQIYVGDSAESVTLSYNVLGDDDGVLGSCTNMDGGTAIIVASVGETPNSTRAYIYGNHIECSRGAGIYIAPEATNVRIGEDAAGDSTGSQHNSIGNNGGAGVLVAAELTAIHNSHIHSNDGSGIELRGVRLATVQNSLIEANAGHGILIHEGADNNIIGCSKDGEIMFRNVIQRNGMDGIHISGAHSESNIVSCNYIGTDETGGSAEPNAGNGIYIGNGATLNRIGVEGGNNELGSLNVISGNEMDGVRIENADNNTIFSSWVGLDATGTKALGNSADGINIIGSAGTRIREAVVSANNSGAGIAMRDGVTQTQVIMASTHANTVAGVAIYDADSIFNNVQLKSAYNNAGPIIDLLADGPTPNDGLIDEDNGPNQLLNSPVVTTVTTTLATGTSCANCTVYVYQRTAGFTQFNGHVEYIGATVADAKGAWLFEIDEGVMLSAESIAVVARDPLGNTSEFSLTPVTQLYLPILRQ